MKGICSLKIVCDIKLLNINLFPSNGDLKYIDMKYLQRKLNSQYLCMFIYDGGDGSTWKPLWSTYVLWKDKNG